jgi:hypothetical protein
MGLVLQIFSTRGKKFGLPKNFGRDRWLDGAKLEDIAPNLYAKLATHTIKVRTVKEGLFGMWLRDCGPD